MYTQDDIKRVQARLLEMGKCITRILENNNIPENYRPLSAWAYFGYQLLFSIPFIGLICLIIFSFSDSNINRKNFARSFFGMYLLVAIIFALFIALGIVTAAVLA